MSAPVLTSRLTFPEDRTAFVYTRPGQPILTPPRTGIKLFTDEAATTPADIRSLDDDAIPYSTIYTGDDCLLPEFLGPEGFVTKLWARVVGGTADTYPLMAQYSDRLALLPTLIHGDGPPDPEIGAVGSFYIDRGLADPGNPSAIDQPLLYGPRTLDGWPEEGVPMRGPSGLVGGTHTHQQPAASDTWDIPHPLPFYPSVTTVDSAMEQMVGDVSYPAPNLVRVRFGAPIAGTAFLT